MPQNSHSKKTFKKRSFRATKGLEGLRSLLDVPPEDSADEELTAEAVDRTLTIIWGTVTIDG